jgi:aspartate racemase
LIGGVIRQDSKLAYLDVIDRLVARGAEGVILGCTEIMLLIGQEDVAIPVFDTTALHAIAAVDFALG